MTLWNSFDILGSGQSTEIQVLRQKGLAVGSVVVARSKETLKSEIAVYVFSSTCPRWQPILWSYTQLWAARCGCWELNSGSLVEPQVILTAKPYLSRLLGFKWSLSLLVFVTKSWRQPFASLEYCSCVL